MYRIENLLACDFFTKTDRDSFSILAICYFPFNFKIILKICIDEYVISTDLAINSLHYFFVRMENYAECWGIIQ